MAFTFIPHQTPDTAKLISTCHKFAAGSVPEVTVAIDSVIPSYCNTTYGMTNLNINLGGGPHDLIILVLMVVIH